MRKSIQDGRDSKIGGSISICAIFTKVTGGDVAPIATPT
jgi:hypothetical protein